MENLSNKAFMKCILCLNYILEYKLRTLVLQYAAGSLSL
jgi:hypothetical protein